MRADRFSGLGFYNIIIELNDKLIVDLQKMSSLAANWNNLKKNSSPSEDIRKAEVEYYLIASRIVPVLSFLSGRKIDGSVDIGKSVNANGFVDYYCKMLNCKSRTTSGGVTFNPSIITSRLNTAYRKFNSNCETPFYLCSRDF